MTARSVSDLAADVRNHLAAHGYLPGHEPRMALEELVARLEAAEAVADQALKDAADLLVHLHKAEAQVAALTQERDVWRDRHMQAAAYNDVTAYANADLAGELQAAEAALADTRRALEYLCAAVEGENGQPWDVDQDCRFCRGHYGEHQQDCEWGQARRVLAATGGGTACSRCGGTGDDSQRDGPCSRCRGTGQEQLP